MKDLGIFTSQYPVSKTLRFELKPIKETEKYINEKGIIGIDEKLAESYKKMKKTIDEFHKDFIEKALSRVQLNHLEEYLALYFADSNEKNSANYDKKFKEVKASLRKEIVQYFKNVEDFKIINKKDLIKKRLEEWIDEFHPELYYDPEFNNFTTYFTGYNENRMNLYSDEEKSTAVAYRLIDENLPRFLDNISVYEKVKNSDVAKEIPQVVKDMEPWLNVSSLDEMFSVNAYNDMLTQLQIDAYNTVIGGRSDENGKIKGLNEYINLYNQQHPDSKLPKMKMLYKQLLSDRGIISWLPEKFNDAQELFDSVEAFSRDVITEELLNNLQTILNELPKRNTSHVYIRNDSSISDISNNLFGYYGVFKDSFEKKNKADYISVSVLQEALDKYVSTLDREEYSYIFKAYSPNCVASYFADKLCDANKDYLKHISDTYAELQSVLMIGHDDKYSLSKTDKELLKAYLDSVMDLLHFVKPLYLENGASVEKDEIFYNTFTPIYEQLKQVTKLYDKVRNFATKKPYSTEKIKLNFGSSTLLNGWDLNKETQNLGILLIKDGNYYLGVMDTKSNKAFEKIPDCNSEDVYQKIMYKLLPGPNKMLPKVFFSKSRIEEFAPSEEIMSIYGKGTFKKGDNFNIEDCHKLIDFFKASIEKHPEWKEYGFKFSPTESYEDISGFYREVSEQGYKLTFKSIPAEYVDSLVNDGKLYLFQIYNKDFSPNAKGNPNLHTMYWKALFDKENLSDVVYKLNGQAEIFYRRKSIVDKQIVHPANQPINKKNPGLEGQKSTFAYDIIKDRRYTVDKYQLHIPITANFKAFGSLKFNEKVCAYLKENPDVKVIGIDRGERHLLYLSMVDRDGKVVKDRDGNYIQYSLNTITGEYKNANGATVKFSTPYHDLLDKKEDERTKARENWGVIENIKELKSGYMSQVVHHISKLMVEYNAIVVMEDLNNSFKNGRKKVEKQVYQNFEKALIEKLNYLVFKDYPVDACVGLYHALQLTERFDSFKKLTKQTGFIFYVPAWCTSKIDPVTGFVDFLKPKYKSVKEAKQFFSKFDSICYNAEKDWFEFSFDYNNFTKKAEGTKSDWTICTYGELRYAYNKRLNNGHGGYEKWNVTEKIKELFAENDIDYTAGDLVPEINVQNKSAFFVSLIKCMQVILAMRYSSADDGKDFILSPVADENGEFFCSEGRTDGLPQDADANGAYNIARKGLCVLEKIDNADKYSDWNTKIPNKEWLNFVHEHS